MADLLTGSTSALLSASEPSPVGPAPADPYADHDAIRSLVTRKLEEWRPGRWPHLLAHWRNIRFYRGHQWEVYEPRSRWFRPATLAPGTPRPVTNRFASSMDAYIAVIARVEPRLTFRPATGEPEDRAAADVADSVIAVVEHETDLRAHRQHLAPWIAFTGGAWLENGYDRDERWGVRQVPVLDALGMPQMDPLTGQPLTESAPVGRQFTDVVPMFEMYWDTAIPVWSQQRACLREKALALDVAKQRWPQFKDQLVPDTQGHPGEFSMDKVAMLSPNLGGPSTYPGGIGAGAPPSKVTERWYWQLPDAVYPEGLLAILLSSTLVAYAGPLPYRELQADGAQRPFLPFVWFPQKRVPGSGWPKTIADDLTMLQVDRNQTQAQIKMILQRASNPVWLVPEGSNVGTFTGQPGQVLRYNPLGLGGAPAKPERIQGQSLPAGLMHWMAQIDKDFEELAGLFEVLKGSRPPGVSAGIALQVLQERAMSRFGPQFIEWELAHAEWARQQLEIFRQFATEERLLRVKGRDGAWEVKKFSAADLAGRVDIVPEAGSSMPRSTLVERAEMEQLLSMGILDGRDPAVKLKVLEQYGKSHLLGGLAQDTKAAIMEHEVFEQLGQDPQAVAAITAALAVYMQRLQAAQQPAPPQMVQGPMGAEMVPGPPPPPPPTYNELAGQLTAQGIKVPRVREAVDDHLVHAKEDATWLKSERALAMPEPVLRLAELHKADHDRLYRESQQAPPPKVNVALRGDVSPQTAETLAGVGGLAGPPQAKAGSGLLDSPQVVAIGRSRGPSATRGGSSPRRMDGDAREMRSAAVAGGE